MDWSAPDDRGIRTHIVHVSPRRRISGERHRVAEKIMPVGQVVLDDGRRHLLKEILGRFNESWKWERVLSLAGPERVDLVYELLTLLLEAGYVKLIERRDSRGWQPIRIEPTVNAELRTLAGVPDPDEKIAALKNAMQYQVRSEFAQKLKSSISAGRVDVRLRRARLLPFLDQWLEAGRSGTRRDFALFTTGHTKGIEDADWRWLEVNDVLEGAGIVEHVPLLLVAGAFALIGADQHRLDVSMARGPLGIPLTAVRESSNTTSPAAWIVIENRTAFDKASVLSTNAGLLWVPGYAPTWWLEVVGALLDRAPAPAIIACDPDPAGIEIALRVIVLWEQRGLSWKITGMDSAALEALPVRIPLSPWDRATLSRIGQIPAPLEEFRQALMELGQKGEQEGYFNESRLAALVVGGN